MKLMASTGRQKPAGQILASRMARSQRRVPCTRIVQRGTLVLPDFRYFGTCMSPEPRGVGAKVNDEKRQGPARFSSVGRYPGRRSSHSSPSSPRAWASSLERPNCMGTGLWALRSSCLRLTKLLFRPQCTLRTCMLSTAARNTHHLWHLRRRLIKRP